MCPGPTTVAWDAPKERRRTKRERFSRAMKAAAKALYKLADNMANGEASRPRTCWQCKSSPFNGLLPEPPSEHAAQQDSIAERLEQRIRRAEERRGRPLIAGERQFVIDQIHMNEAMWQAIDIISSDQ